MNSELDARWRNAVMPFNEDVLLIEEVEDLSLEQLKSVLSLIVEDLQNHWKHAELAQVTDWHEHDGYLEAGTAINWGEIRDWLESTESLRAASPSEQYVNRGVFPLGFEWYLRFTIDDDDPEELFCSVELTGSNDLLNRVARKMNDDLSVSTTRQPARDYFDRISAS